MTVKELIELFNEYAELDEGFMNFKVVMVGHNDYGERLFNIPTKDITANYDDGVIRLWDR